MGSPACAASGVRAYSRECTSTSTLDVARLFFSGRVNGHGYLPINIFMPCKVAFARFRVGSRENVNIAIAVDVDNKHVSRAVSLEV